MTMLKTLYLRDDIDRLYVPRNEQRGFASIEDRVDASMQVLKDYIKEQKKSNYSG